MVAPRVTPATRYLSSLGDNQHPQGWQEVQSLVGELASHGMTPSKPQATLEKCAKCQGLIVDHVVHALGKGYHPGCFSCSACGRAIGTESFALGERDEVYCVTDFYRCVS